MLSGMAIVTYPPRSGRKRSPALQSSPGRAKPGQFGEAPDLTPEEHRRRGDASEAPVARLIRRHWQAQGAAAGETSDVMRLTRRARVTAVVAMIAAAIPLAANATDWWILDGETVRCLPAKSWAKSSPEF